MSRWSRPNSCSSNINEFKQNSQLRKATPNVEDCPSNCGLTTRQPAVHRPLLGSERLAVILMKGWTTFGRPLYDDHQGWRHSKAGDYLISKVSLAEGRHFGPINQMGFEGIKAMTATTVIFLKFGLLYKSPEQTSSDRCNCTDFNGESNKEKTGYFFYMRNIGNFERATKTRVTASMKSIFSFALLLGLGQRTDSYVELFNMRFGWGEEDPHETTKICLPNIRPWDMAHLPSYGDD